MSAGLPGLGLGGLFFILSALALPLFELVRTARGESSAASWLGVARQFGLAVLMIAAIDAVFRILGGLLGSDAGGSGGLLAIPIGPVLVTIGILAMVLAGAKALQLVAWLRTAHAARGSVAARPLRATLLAPIRPTVRRAVGALAVVWLLTVFVATTDFGPLPPMDRPESEALGDEPEDSQLAIREPPSRALPRLAGLDGNGDRRSPERSSRDDRRRSEARDDRPAAAEDASAVGEPDTPASREPPEGPGGNGAGVSEDPPTQSNPPPSGGGAPPVNQGGGGGSAPQRPETTPSGRDISGGRPSAPPGRGSAGRPAGASLASGSAPGQSRP